MSIARDSRGALESSLLLLLLLLLLPPPSARARGTGHAPPQLPLFASRVLVVVVA